MGIPPVDCYRAAGTPASATASWNDDPHQATVVIQNADTCARTYELSTTGPLRDGVPQNPRVYSEIAGQPVVRTGHAMFDALYALAIEESREASVESISDGAFNGGNPLPCEAGGCFETGRLWKYVWTRDTAYSMALGLGLLDPLRARTSLVFKTSTKRDGSQRAIVQDTGTGGSWPISTDRVVWAMGAIEVLKVLEGDERTAFRDLAYEAIVNTAERDRVVVWDPRDGLYRGEQSFLDWREQTYPAWTTTDTVQIGMSKALGTNIGHLVMLDMAAQLAAEKNDSAASQKYTEWATALRQAIRSRLYLPDRKMYSTFVTTELDQAPTLQYDLLGSAFAVLFEVATPAQAADIVAQYPHLPKGPPVIWPQQRDVRIYHNRGIWPFVTAFWAKAAAKVGNADAVDHAVHSLARGAALNLSNMENFEVVSGANMLHEGPTSGPVVNSQRQLWSVAGYISMVHDVLFGLEATQKGVRFRPNITRSSRNTLFAGMNQIALSNVKFQGKTVNVVVSLPEAPATNGMLDIARVRLNGNEISTDFVDVAMLGDFNLFEVELSAGSDATRSITVISEQQASNPQFLYGPRTPAISSLSIVNDRVQVGFTVPENGSDVTFNVYRNGSRVAENLPGTTTNWLDPDSGAHATTTYCYTVEAVFGSSGNASQRAQPSCYWGPNAQRIQTWNAQTFQANGGTLTFNHGRWHYEDWGDPNDTLMIANVQPTQSGWHYLQVEAGNGAGNVTSGITCGMKAIEVWESGTLVGGGYLTMPHLAAPGDPNPWGQWRTSNLIPVNLTAGKTYFLVIREDMASGNMSDYAHFATYGGAGGQAGRFNKVNISEVRLLAFGP
ncbi:MAG: hypothetical protein IPM54_37835 [Polyangiaceae bacterium]|nr:hypothetical protein [Polyangiaceae bacterium]